MLRNKWLPGCFYSKYNGVLEIFDGLNKKREYHLKVTTPPHRIIYLPLGFNRGINKTRPTQIFESVSLFYTFYIATIPENPMNAIARIPAVIKAMGNPFIPLGILTSSRCSRIPAKIVSASPNPIAMEAA